MTTRRKTEIFGVGQPLETLPQDVLPTGMDVLRFYGHLCMEKMSTKTSPEPSISCKQRTSSNSLTCNDSEGGGCTDTSPCLVASIIKPWTLAGFKTISGKSVKIKVLKLIKTHKLLKKQKRILDANSMGKKLAEFQNEVKQLFDIGVKDLEDVIMKDRFR